MAAPRFDVLSYGTLGVDRILRVPHLPTADLSTHSTSETICLGGKATNSAVLLARWGLSVAISGTAIGHDETGKTFYRMLEEHQGVNTEYVGRRNGKSSMYCCILVTPDGERAIIGVNVDEGEPTLPTPEMIEDAHVLTLDLYGGQERVHAARLAADAGRPVIVGDLRDPQHAILESCTVAIASAAEVRSSHPGVTLAEYADTVQDSGTGNVIITEGGQGVYVFPESGGSLRLQAPKVNVVDTTGAGDAFRAGVTYGIRKGLPLVECAAIGTAAGSLNVQRVGASSDLPSLAEAEELAEAVLRTATRL